MKTIVKITDPDQIIEARRKLGYTQVQLAGLLRCTQQHLSALELGRSGCSLELAAALCGRLGVKRTVFGLDRADIARFRRECEKYRPARTAVPMPHQTRNKVVNNSRRTAAA